MDISQELQSLNENVGQKLFYEYFDKTVKIIERLGPMEWDPSVPFEVWLGIATALAASSGYRIILQETIVGDVPNSNGTFPIVGYRDREIVEPTEYVKIAAPGRSVADKLSQGHFSSPEDHLF